MPRWLEPYQLPGGKGKDQAIVDVNVEGLKTAMDVHEALEEGNVPNAYFLPNSIIFVQRMDENTRPAP